MSGLRQEYAEIAERMGLEKSHCKVCGNSMYVEFEYQFRGVCCTCVRQLAHEYCISHSGQPSEEFSTTEQWAEYKARSSQRQNKSKDKIRPSLRKRVMERDAYRCQQCGDHHDLHVDHVYPESKGGKTELGNLQVLCKTCNMAKGAKIPE